ncbi:Uncharacterised protein [Sebaldella termitidis]|uniref:Uncharacterized protein n=1 Tax=Sebaldella termitidis (strain ATCC 33386 / NCTC 11300) TaxID=526218 RepID=D1AMV2_SEBTE|nr:hypothetical protein [Sebaldella termitidis]ACZ07328.1 hypothetical protein Sterm_0448 [Sebaldella termitidis ATCC 33386]SUI22621.1 Uncharacterised protein [Sebaldella termitidis]
MLKEKIMEILSTDTLENLYFSGDFDENIREFIINKKKLYLEFSKNIICVNSDENILKLSIVLNNKFENQPRVKINEIVFINSLIEERKVVEVTFDNLLYKMDELLVEGLMLELSDHEYICLKPAFFGIEICKNKS